MQYEEVKGVKWKQAQECFRNAELVVLLTLNLDNLTSFFCNGYNLLY